MGPKMFLYIVFLLLAGVVLSLSGGCASADKELADAEAALQEAREAGAPELAPEEYQAAEELIARAKELISEGKGKAARELLVEARYKAIEAKGKASVAQRESQMAEGERLARERELEELKARGLGQLRGLEDVFFDFDRSDIRADARPVLRENASIIREAGKNVVVIEGYCDVRGTEEYNLALGQRRADSAKSFLVGLGVEPGLIEPVSRGETEEFAPGTTERAYQLNRRAHFLTSPR